MKLVLIALGFTVVLAAALAVQAIFDSAVAGWISFATIFVLGIGWSLGLLPGGSSVLGDD